MVYPIKRARKTVLKLFVMALFTVFSMASYSAHHEEKLIKLYQVNSGIIEMDKGYLTAMRDVGTIIKVPVAMYIIDHPKGLVLYDTGTNVAIADGNCANYWGEGLCAAFHGKQTRDEVIDRWLEKFGYSVSDVKYVVTSHMHLDHGGNTEMFPDATHVVQKAEMRAAWWPERFQRAAFVLGDYDDARDFNYFELEGDFDLFGDGTMIVLETKGHTQGHQSLMVKLKNTGTLLLAGDAVYTPENENGVTPGITWSTNESMKSIDRLKMIRDREQGEIWYSHGRAQFNSHKHDSAYD